MKDKGRAESKTNSRAEKALSSEIKRWNKVVKKRYSGSVKDEMNEGKRKKEQKNEEEEWNMMKADREKNLSERWDWRGVPVRDCQA